MTTAPVPVLRVLKLTAMLLTIVAFQVRAAGSSDPFGQHTATAKKKLTAPPAEIIGVVTDDKGATLTGVSVMVKGTNKGTSTNANGTFRIDASSGDVLEFSMLGYKKVSVTVGNSLNMTVTLEPDATALSIVVAGYGAKKKVNLTGAISVVKGEELENRPVLNATQSLQCLVPGLNVSVGSGTKPGQSYSLNIRGAGNLAGGDGRFVLVDGLPMSPADINPNDIEFISILKDAAASAKYAARAPFGVILVTVKKGKADRTTISYSNNFGITRQINLPDMANSYDFALYYNMATFYAQGSKQYSHEKLQLLEQYVNNQAGINIFPEATDNYLTNWENTANGVTNTNWFDFFYKPSAFRQQHNLGVIGGSKATQYFISGGYYDEDGLMRYANIKYKRFNFNTTLTSQVTNWTKLKLTSKLTQDKYTVPFSSGGTFENLFLHNLCRMRPNISPYDLNGNFNEISSMPYFQSGSQAITKSSTLVLLPGEELEPVKDWKIFADVNIRRDEGESYTPLRPGVIYGIDGTPKYVNRSGFGIPLLGSFSGNEDSNVYVSPNISTSYHYILKDDHDLNMMIGFQQELNEFSSLTSSAQDLISDSRPGISLSTRPPVTSEFRNHWATQGYFSRLSYYYREKYLLELNDRYDSSSHFAPDSQWGFFPFMSVEFNIAKEGFMENFRSIINTLKLRAFYGLLGNQAGAGLYSYIQSMGVSIPGINGAGPAWFFQNGREGIIFATPPFNAGTAWEKVYTINLGLDFNLLRNRLSGSIDVPHQNRS